METKQLLSYLFSFFLSSLFEVGKAKWSPGECLNAGYSANLLCNSCDDLKQFNLSALESSCRECCETVKEDTDRQYYAKATLKVCQWKIGRYPQIQGVFCLVALFNYPKLT